MNIEALLEEINIDIVRLTAVNSLQEDMVQKQHSKNALRKIEIYYEAFSKEALTLNKQLGFFDKMQLKRDINNLYKSLKETETEYRTKVAKTEQLLTKLCSKYRAGISIDSLYKQNLHENSVYHEETPQDAEKKDNIQSQEYVPKESAMARRVREYQEYIMRDDQVIPKEKEKVYIKYDLKSNVYYLDGEAIIEGAKRLTTPKEKSKYIASKVKDMAEYKYLIDGYFVDESKVLKKCDPYVIGLLLKKDVKLARDYIRKMTGISSKSYSTKDFDITYDVRGLEGPLRSKFSFMERVGIKNMIKNAKKVAKVVEDKKKLPWYATIPFIGALTIAGVSGTTAALNSGNQNRNNDSRDSYSDTMKPGKTTDDEVHPTYTTDYGLTTETTENTTTTTIATERATEATEEYSQIDKVHDVIRESDKKEDSKEDEKIVVNIGDKISVQDGLKYTANCLGQGNSNKIGAVSWRPATEYSVDRVAFVHEGKVLGIMNAGDQDVEKTLNEIAEKNGIDAEDISTSVLLSLVPGTGDTGWANINLNDMQKNISKQNQEQQENSAEEIDFEAER